MKPAVNKIKRELCKLCFWHVSEPRDSVLSSNILLDILKYRSITRHSYVFVTANEEMPLLTKNIDCMKQVRELEKQRKREEKENEQLDQRTQ